MQKCCHRPLIPFIERQGNVNLHSGLSYAIKKEEGLKWKLQLPARLTWSGSTLEICPHRRLSAVYCLSYGPAHMRTQMPEILLGFPYKQSTSDSCNQHSETVEYPHVCPIHPSSVPLGHFKKNGNVQVLNTFIKKPVNKQRNSRYLQRHNCPVCAFSDTAVRASDRRSPHGKS